MTQSSPSGNMFQEETNGVYAVAEQTSRFNFTRELRIIEEIRRAAGGSGVNWMTMNHVEVLLLVLDMTQPEGIEAQTLAKITGHLKSTVNRIIHSLSDGDRGRGRGTAKSTGLGIITLRDDPMDGRIKRIHLTPYGQRLKKHLLEANTEADPEAEPLRNELRGHMYQSKSNVIEAAATTAEIKVSASARGQVGNVEVLVNEHNKGKGEPQDKPEDGWTKMRPKKPRLSLMTQFSQTFDALQRGLKYAAKTGLDEVKYRGVMVPLLSHQNAMKGVKAGELYEAKSFGVWVYHDNPVGDDHAAMPRYILGDLPQLELDNFAKKISREIIEHEKSVDKVFTEVRQQLNGHQAKWVVDVVVKRLGTQRTNVENAKDNLIHRIRDDEKQADELIQQGHHLAREGWNSGSPTAEKSYLGAAHKLSDQAIELQRQADKKSEIQENLTREAKELAAKQEELMARINQLNDD